MHLSTQIAKHLNDVFYGGNWTSVNMREHLTGLTWQQATARIYDLNSIAALTFHINYFVEAQIDVLSGKPLNAHDKFSFDLPPIQSQNDWEDLLQRVWSNAEKCVELINQLPTESMGGTSQMRNTAHGPATCMEISNTYITTSGRSLLSKKSFYFKINLIRNRYVLVDDAWCKRSPFAGNGCKENIYRNIED